MMPLSPAHPPFPYALRPELERVVNDVEALKTGHTELRLLLNEQSQEQTRQSRMLENIQRALEEEKSARDFREKIRQQERARRDYALKRTIWIASALGPALLTTLWHLLYLGR